MQRKQWVKNDKKGKLKQIFALSNGISINRMTPIGQF